MSQGLLGTYKSSMYAFRDSNGYPVGENITPDTTTPGTVYGAYLYDKHTTLGASVPSFETRFGRSGGKIWTKKVVGISDIGNFSVEMAGLDTTLEGYLKGYTPDVTTVTTAIGLVPNEVPDVLPKFVSAHHMEFDNADGSPEWLSLFYLNSQFTDTSGIAAGQGSGENPNPLSYEGVPDYSLRAPWGQLFSAAASNLTVTDDKAQSVAVISQWRYAIATYIDDGAATTYTLPFLPASAVVGNHYVFRNGTAITPSGIVTTTGVVTITAGTSGDVIVHLYPVGARFTASP